MAHERGALAPTQHQYHHRAADGDREPAAVDDLQRVGGEKGRVDGAKDHDDEDCERGRPLPASDRHAIEQDGRDQHGPGHGDAVGAGQILRALEQHDDQQRADHQQPIGGRHVDLTGFLARCRHDPHARAKPHLHRLPSEREDAGDERLGGDDGRQRRQRDQRNQGPMRRQFVERAVDRRGIGEDERALAEIVQQQRRQHQAEPGAADGAGTDMAMSA